MRMMKYCVQNGSIQEQKNDETKLSSTDFMGFDVFLATPYLDIRRVSVWLRRYVLFTVLPFKLFGCRIKFSLAE
jgi:hypothetical protein